MTLTPVILDKLIFFVLKRSGPYNSTLWTRKDAIDVICNRLFSRQWNLDRHLQDVHEINDDIKKEKSRGGIDGYDYEYGQLNMDSANNLMKTDNKNNDMDYNGNSYVYNNFSNLYPSPGYYTSEPYIYSNYNSLSKEKKTLNSGDKIKIQKVLKFVENYLERLYPKTTVFQIISRLRYRCLREKSDEPLKKFLVRNNMGHL